MSAVRTNPMLWLLWVWRLALAAASGWALWLLLGNRSGEQAFDQLIYFTTLSTLMVFLFALAEVVRPFLLRRKGLARFEASSAWLRGFATAMTVFTGIVFATLLDGDYPDAAGLIAHLICPAAMAADWVLVGRNQARLHVLSPLTWGAILLPYVLVLYPWDAREDGMPMYEFLDPRKGDWPVMVGAVVVAFLLLAYALWGIGRLRAKVVGGSR